MWLFTSHSVVRPALWTWALVDARGGILRRSSATFFTYRKALEDAKSHGFDPERDEHRKEAR